MAERPMTRSEAMLLADEKRLVQQGYEFLDEKRVILAGEIMRMVGDWKALARARDAALDTARSELAKQVRWLGFEMVQTLDAPGHVPAPSIGSRRFLGVPLVTGGQAFADPETAAGRDHKSPHGKSLGTAFLSLHRILVEMAVLSTNLLRLADEYRRTEQRAKALEFVLIPEIDADLRRIENQLEANEQEDAIRVRVVARKEK